MTPHLESIAGFASTVASSIFGYLTLPFIAQAAATDPLPDYVKWVLGPVGALVGMIFAIRWLTARLDKAETREEARRVEREASLKTLVELGVRSQAAIEQNSQVLIEVKEIIARKP